MEPLQHLDDLPLTSPGPGIHRKFVYFNDLLLLVIEFEPGAGGKPHTHTWSSLYFVLEGQGRALQGDQWYDVGPGSIFLIPDGPEHTFHAVTRVRLLEVQFPCPSWFVEQLAAQRVGDGAPGDKS